MDKTPTHTMVPSINSPLTSDTTSNITTSPMSHGPSSPNLRPWPPSSMTTSPITAHISSFCGDTSMITPWAPGQESADTSRVNEEFRKFLKALQMYDFMVFL